MSIAAINRSFRVVAYLKVNGEASFGELAAHLAPISNTAASQLLSSLVEIGELQHEGRRYWLRQGGASLSSAPSGIYSLPQDIRAQTHIVLERAALDTMHSCALFGWVGISTMRILDLFNLEASDWHFRPIGYEWPLVPFHGFAQVFLANAPEMLARDCFFRWHPYLQGHLRFDSYRDFEKRLKDIRENKYAIEYRGEVKTILRIVVPLELKGQTTPRYAVGLSANAVHLIEAKEALVALQAAKRDLTEILDGRVPLFRFDEEAELIRLRSKELPKKL